MIIFWRPECFCLNTMAGGRRSQTSRGGKMSGASNTYPCGNCSKSVVGAESSIACDMCDRWYHGTEACTGMSRVLIEEILKSGGNRIRFSCPHCESNGAPVSSSENIGQVQALSDMVNKLFTTVSDLSSQVAALVIKLREVRDHIASNKSTSPLPCDPAQLQEIVQMETRELHEREKRKDSIIIRGIPLDTVQPEFNRIVSFLCPNLDSIILSDVVPIKHNLLRAKILNHQHRLELLAQTKKLAGSCFSSVFISRDLTFKQRSQLKVKRGGGSGSGGGVPVASSVPVGTRNTGAPQEAAASGNPTVVHSPPAESSSPVAASSFAGAAAGDASPRLSLPPFVDHTPGGSVRERVANFQLGK